MSERKNGISVRRTAQEVKRYKTITKILPIAISIMLGALMLLYVSAVIYDRSGRFTVSVNPTDAKYALTLSDYRDFKQQNAVLASDAVLNATNISGQKIYENPTIGTQDGSNNGENYLEHTFYCKNVGTETFSFTYKLVYNNVVNHLDEVIRVRLYVNGVPTTYAKTRSDGLGKETYYCDQEFYGNNIVADGIIKNVKPGDITKFTVVVWIEGDDLDCDDSKINGEIKLDMIMNSIVPE